MTVDAYDRRLDTYFGVLPFRLIPFRLIFTVSFRVTVCLGLGIGLGIRLGSGLGKMGLGEMGQNPYFTRKMPTEGINV